jgi:putative tryptophan/tyrosine transport system substrate-binding protein
MHELVPAADLIAVLVNPANPATEPITREMQIAARVFGVRLLILKASSQSDIEAAFATLVRERAGGLVTDPDPFFTSHRDQIVALAARHAVPTLEQTREFTAAGGLMAYGSNLQDGWRVVGSYTGRILKGEKPADLPVQQATKIEMVINLKTAVALGLTVPQSILLRADQVIE